MPEGTRVVVTFPGTVYDLRKRGIDETLAADPRARLGAFAEEWDSPEMDIYDNYDAIKRAMPRDALNFQCQDDWPLRSASR